MKQQIMKVLSNEKIAKDIMKMVLGGETDSLCRPGQFINIKLEGKYLRRPISVCDYTEDTITIIYKIVGAGTEQMAEMKSGDSIDILNGLGNGFDTEKGGDKPLLIGGGVGVPPMYGVCKELIAKGKKVNVILGFNTADDVFYKDEFEKLGATVHIATADGSVGTKGFVTDIMSKLDYTYFFTCGPMPMFSAIEKIANTSGQYSFEERMGCGFGACMGCSCETKYGGSIRICRDGPVLEREVIKW